MVARRQLLALGLSRRAIALRLERGRLHPIHRGVYAVGHAALTRRGQWMAAVLAAGVGAVLESPSSRSPVGVNGTLTAAGRLIETAFIWPRERLIVENRWPCDRWHGSPFERDRERDRLLLVDGWRVVRVTWRQLLDFSERVADDLRRLLGVGRGSTL